MPVASLDSFRERLRDWAAGRLTVEDLRLFLRELGLAPFKCPEQVVYWDALPKNAAGKIMKLEIRTTLIAGAG